MKKCIFCSKNVDVSYGNGYEIKFSWAENEQSGIVSKSQFCCKDCFDDSLPDGTTLGTIFDQDQ